MTSVHPLRLVCQGRLRTLEADAEQERRLGLQLELLKKDKSRLLSQLTAQESIIDGLRAERKIWGQELAQQGRGRHEVFIVHSSGSCTLLPVTPFFGFSYLFGSYPGGKKGVCQ